MTVVVLGAGATRGASFVELQKNPCLPPLDTDFFTQLQRIRNPKHQDLVDAVMADAHDLFGVNFRVSLETMFTTIEQTIRMVKATRESREWRTAELEPMRSRLMQAIGAVLEESLQDGTAGNARKSETCEHHRSLVNSLKPADTILSFNYDCLIDQALKDAGAGKWNARYGYGFDLGSRGSRLEGDQEWQPVPPSPKDGTIHLYKLHGSLHFQISEEPPGIVLKARPYTKQHGALKFTIIPPESNKAYDQGSFSRLWKLASTAIHKAERLIFIGYSLPPTDMHSTVLFRTSVKKEALKSLVVVNPDRESRFRTREVVRRGLSKRTRVLSFDRFSEFASASPELWRG